MRHLIHGVLSNPHINVGGCFLQSAGLKDLQAPLILPKGWHVVRRYVEWASVYDYLRIRVLDSRHHKSIL